MLEDYFSLQLRFSERYAIAAGAPLNRSIAQCTNLRRRLNLWGPAGATRWDDFLAQVGDSVNSHTEVLRTCMGFYETRPHVEANQHFGCFSFDPPDGSGAIRIHFVAPEATTPSPLASENMDARVQELRALFSHVRRTHRNVVSVRGVSWPYNLHAYKRLFPPSYAASVTPVSFPLHLNGSSTWGQVLNWRQELKSAVCEAVLARLSTMRVDAPWETFPLQALGATGDVEDFYELFN